MSKRLMCILLLMLLIIGSSKISAYSYSKYYLKKYENSTLLMGCDFNDRAGTLHLHENHARYPTGSFDVNVTYSTECPIVTRLYFNVKTLDLNRDDQVYFTVYGSVLKTLTGGPHNPSSDPTSVAQFYSPTSYVFIQFVKGDATRNSSGDPLTIDFSWINRSNLIKSCNYRGFVRHVNKLNSIDVSSERSGEILCSALEGFLPKSDLMCESGDRVNCPRTYFDDFGVSNPALFTDQNYCGLGSMAIVAIAVSATFILTCCLTVAVCRRRRTRTVCFCTW